VTYGVSVCYKRAEDFVRSTFVTGKFWVNILSTKLTVSTKLHFLSFQMPSLNPSRALGPAFVMNKWDSHWVSLVSLTSSAVYILYRCEKQNNANQDEIQQVKLPHIFIQSIYTSKGW